MDIQTTAKVVGNTLRDRAPAILTAMGAVGVISTAVLAARGHERAYYKAPEDRKAYPFKEWFPLYVKATWKDYTPAVISGVVTISCIVAANSVNAKRHAAVMGLYSLTETAFRDYKHKVVETIGETKEQAIRDEVAADVVNRNPAKSSEIYITGSGKMLCYDQLSGRYFESDMENIRKAQNNINALTINETYASQNDFYRELGLPPIGIGEEIGWRTDHMLDIHFSSVLSEDGKPCLSINYVAEPIRGYYKGFI